MWKHKTFKTVSILLPLVFAFAVAQDIYIPSVPQLVTVFHTSQTYVQLTLSLFMVGFGLGQLFIGPYSDQFGRRNVALLSAVAYTATSLLCASAHSIAALIIYRMLQAASSCGMMVSANAIVRDAFDARESGKMYSYLNGAIAVSPLFAPLLGGYLDVYFGWRACFIALAVLGVIAAGIVSFQVPETLAKHKRIKVDRGILKRYITIACNREFQFYTGAVTVGVTFLFTFFSCSPYILINSLGVERQNFGYYFGVMGLLFLLGSVLAGRTIHKMGVRYNILLGAALSLAGGLLMFLWFYMFGLSRMGFIIPMVPVSLGASFLIGSGVAGALAPFGEMAGTAAALMGAVEFLGSAMMGTMVMQWKMDTTAPYATEIIILSGVMLIWWMARKTP